MHLCMYLVATVLAHLSAISLALAAARAYIRSRDIALVHVVFLLQALHCVWCKAT